MDGRPADLATWFDLASLTKPLATGLSVLALAAQGELALDGPVAHHLPRFASAGKGAVTIRDLLDHSSGLPAWRPYFLGRGGFAAGREGIDRAVDAEPLERPPGEATVYSDIGFLALGRVVEAVAGEPLDAFVRRELFPRLGIDDLALFDLMGAGVPQGLCIAPTGTSRPRIPAPGQEAEFAGAVFATVGLRPGEVDDDNAYARGGVAGHAGLFGTAAAVARIGEAFREELAGAARLAPLELARRFERPAQGRARPLAWDRPSPFGSSLGTKLGLGPRGAIGHLGFTGCSLWIDLDRELVAALLTNRVLAGRSASALAKLRPTFHDTLADALR